jgi:hypothetical protein
VEECQSEYKFSILEALAEVLFIAGFTEVIEGSSDTSLESSRRFICDLVTILENRHWEGWRWV